MIVVDTSPFFHGPMLATLDRTDELLLVCGLDVPTLKNVRLSAADARAARRSRSDAHPRRPQPGELEGRHEAERGRGRPRASRSASRSRATAPSRSRVNRGKPAVARRARLRTSPSAIREMAKGLAAEPSSRRTQKRGVFGQGGASHGSPRSPQANGNGAGRGRRAPRSTSPCTRRASQARRARRGGSDPYAELKTRDPPRVHREARPGALHARDERGPHRARAARRHGAARARPDAADARGAAPASSREITDDILGYGPLEPLLRDDSVTEIMVNGPDTDLRRARRASSSGPTSTFVDDAHLLRIIDKIVSQVGRRVDESSPMVDARLPDGSRVNAIIPPLALDGPDAHDPEVRARPVHDGRPGRLRLAHAAGRAVPRRVRPRASSTSSSPAVPAPARRRLLNALSAFVPERRAHRHDRGRGRAPAPAGARDHARVAPAEHRGPGRGHASATSSATPCACAPTGSSSARSAAPRRSTCSRR